MILLADRISLFEEKMFPFSIVFLGIVLFSLVVVGFLTMKDKYMEYLKNKEHE